MQRVAGNVGPRPGPLRASTAEPSTVTASDTRGSNRVGQIKQSLERASTELEKLKAGPGASSPDVEQAETHVTKLRIALRSEEVRAEGIPVERSPLTSAALRAFGNGVRYAAAVAAVGYQIEHKPNKNWQDYTATAGGAVAGFVAGATITQLQGRRPPLKSPRDRMIDKIQSKLAGDGITHVTRSAIDAYLDLASRGEADLSPDHIQNTLRDIRPDL